MCIKIYVKLEDILSCNEEVLNEVGIEWFFFLLSGSSLFFFFLLSDFSSYIVVTHRCLNGGFRRSAASQALCGCAFAQSSADFWWVQDGLCPKKKKTSMKTQIFPIIFCQLKNNDMILQVERGAGGTRVYTWHHRQFVEAAERRYLHSLTTKHKIHSDLADYFSGRWAGKTSKPFQYTHQQVCACHVCWY